MTPEQERAWAEYLPYARTTRWRSEEDRLAYQRDLSVHGCATSAVDPGGIRRHVPYDEVFEP